MTNYIIGYGSLINKDSRFTTSFTGNCIPVNLKHYKRSWNARINKFNRKYTAVSVEKSFKDTINAIMVAVNSKDLKLFDKREKNYRRVLVDNCDVTNYETNRPINKKYKIWIYVIDSKFRKLSSYKYPILQSYIDIILSGCCRISSRFVEDFINSTENWSGHNKLYNWINDRKNPIYKYKCSNNEKDRLRLIDSILKKYKPEEFSKIKYVI